jgi:hypothetical protein
LRSQLPTKPTVFVSAVPPNTAKEDPAPRGTGTEYSMEPLTEWMRRKTKEAPKLRQEAQNGAIRLNADVARQCGECGFPSLKTVTLSRPRRMREEEPHSESRRPSAVRKVVFNHQRKELG